MRAEWAAASAHFLYTGKKVVLGNTVSRKWRCHFRANSVPPPSGTTAPGWIRTLSLLDIEVNHLPNQLLYRSWWFQNKILIIINSSCTTLYT